MSAIKISREAYLATLQPPPDLTVSTWADAYRMLSSEASAEPGRWNTDRAPYQRGILDSVRDSTVEEIVVMSSAQVGKALDINTPIATPKGWVLMGDISVGDTVFGLHGEPVLVSYVSPIYTNRDCYCVTFSDGSEIVADAEHRWHVESDTPITPGMAWHGAGEKTGVLTTAQMLDGYKYGSRGQRNRYAIPVCAPIQCDAENLLIDPYLLGVWLGDGHSYGARITASVDDCDFIAGEFIKAGHAVDIEKHKSAATIQIDRKQAHICPRGHDKNVTGWSGRGCAECGRVMSKNHGLKKRGSAKQYELGEIEMTFNRKLSALDLMENKHIPAMYLRASVAQRFALLQGLMDTDGCIGTNGRCEFVTTSEKLRDGFAELLSSLGVKHTLAEKLPTTTYKGQRVYGSMAYRFSFLVYSDEPVFRMPRKLARMVSREGRRTTETDRRRIVSIKKVESVPVRCIQVESKEHLYLAGREMIPTHNTELLLNVIGFHVHHDPAPMLLLQPTLEMAEAFSKDRLAPMVRDTPALTEKIADPKSRDSGNTMLHKKFAGGHLTMAGANSPSSLASRPIRVILCDEVDRYPESAGTEGDPVNLARKRTATFWNRKVLLTSTPTIKGLSRIESAYEASDQRRYFVPCPHCDGMQTLKWSNVKWSEGDTSTAAYYCEHCGAQIEEVEKIGMLRKGEWRAGAPFKGSAGFHLNELYSPWRKWSEVAADFIQAKNGGTEMLKAWVNTSLGESWEEQGDTMDPANLMSRLESYTYADLSVSAITCGVDVQKDRLECTVVGWSVGEESWLIDHVILPGDTAQTEVWKDLDDLLADFRPHAVAIDSGFNTSRVYEFVQARRYCFAIKGVTGAGRPLVEDARKRAQRLRRRKGVHVEPIGVDGGKVLVYSRLKLSAPGPGYVHFPDDAAFDDEYFAQLGAEKLVTKYRFGRPFSEWVQMRPRNEALDCFLYALAALRLCGKRLDAPVKTSDAVTTYKGRTRRRVVSSVRA